MRTPLPKSAPKSIRLAPVAAALAAMAFSPHSLAVTYDVTNTADSGLGSLRAAMQTAVTNCFTDPAPIIRFAIPTGPFTISPTGELPMLGCGSTSFSPTLDGYSAQPTAVQNSSSTWNANVPIHIDGLALGYGGVCGIRAGNLYGGTLKVSGVVVSNFNASANSGICIPQGTLDLKGSIIQGNHVGISGPFTGAMNIGGASPADRNLIISNDVHGIYNAAGGDTTYNIQNNFIGVASDGVSYAGNSGSGIYLQGGTGAGSIAFNYIGGNSQNGVYLSNQTNIDINGNFIGLGTDGSTAVSNNQAGILIDTATASGIQIRDNHISQNTVGVSIANGDGVKITHNFIFSNPTKAIQLNVYGGSAPLDNDPGDADTGPNLQQNFPSIDGVNHISTDTYIDYSLNSTPNTTFQIEFFANDSVGTNEGKTPIGTVGTITTDGAGNFAGMYWVTGLYDNITATARNIATNDTSEFSYSLAFSPSAAVNVAPPIVNFGNVPVGSTSPTQTVSATSTGSLDWYIDSIQLRTSPSCYGGTIAYGGEFMYTTDCVSGSNYPSGTGCSFSTKFSPTILGPQTVYICIFDNTSPDGFQAVKLTGNGSVPPTLSLLPSSYDFGGVSVGSTSPTARFLLNNPGTTSVSYSMGISGPFEIAGTDCQNPINGGVTCNILATFKPTTQGFASGMLLVSPTSGGTSASSSLSGQGTVGPALVVPNSIEFLYTLGADPTLFRLTLTNSGSAPLDISGVTISGPPFTLVNPCPPSLAPRESCVLTLGYSTSTTGTFEGTLLINTNAGGQRRVQLFGLSQTAPVPLIEVTPREMGYGNRALGATSPQQTVTIRNIGGAPAILSSLTTSPDFVLVRNGCPTTLAPLASCTADVAMRATAYGQRRGTLSVASNAERSPHTVSLLGTSCRVSGLILGRLGVTKGCAP